MSKNEYILHLVCSNEPTNTTPIFLYGHQVLFLVNPHHEKPSSYLTLVLTTVKHVAFTFLNLCFHRLLALARSHSFGALFSLFD